MQNKHIQWMGVAFMALLLGCSSYQPALAERPIPFGPERKQLTREYLQEHYGLPGEEATIEPRMIVLHWTAIPSLEGSYEAFRPERLPNARGDIQGGGALNVSAHYLIDRDGTIYHLMPDTVMARHTIGLNHCAIGIENVGGTAETPLTKEQFRANKWLVRELSGKYPIEYLIGHYEYTLFDGHPLWLEQDSGYRTEKTDPGEAFMAEMRKALGDLNFKPLPENQ
jgi:N-acetyl-anhydromuramyl-L-alanine amidase AmpD